MWAAQTPLPEVLQNGSFVIGWTFYTQNHIKFLPISFILIHNFHIYLHFPLPLFLTLTEIHNSGRYWSTLAIDRYFIIVAVAKSHRVVNRNPEPETVYTIHTCRYSPRCVHDRRVCVATSSFAVGFAVRRAELVVNQKKYPSIKLIAGCMCKVQYDERAHLVVEWGELQLGDMRASYFNLKTKYYWSFIAQAKLIRRILKLRLKD